MINRIEIHWYKDIRQNEGAHEEWRVGKGHLGESKSFQVIYNQCLGSSKKHSSREAPVQARRTRQP